MELVKTDVMKYQPLLISRIIYRLFDILVGLIGCCLTLILLVIVKIAYWYYDGDKESVIFVQNRIGYKGKEFRFYKIRTMVPDADRILEEILLKDEKLRKEYKINKKLENDPRVTKIGNILRKTSLDEFPQFFNVLIGNMTLVGPRPYLPREKEDMGSTYHAIIQCKPAITGPWQIGGRSDINFKDRCEIDVQYIQEKTLLLDIKIFLKTIISVLHKDGAK